MLAVNGLAIPHVAEGLRQCPHMALLAVRTTPRAFARLSRTLRDDRVITLEALSGDGAMLNYAGYALRCARDVVLAAVANDWTALRFALDDLNDDEDIVLTAVERNGAMLSCVGDDFKR